MARLRFPTPFRHEHPAVHNVNDLVDQRLSRGQRAADAVAAAVGSWNFMLIQSALLLLWVALNVAAYIRHWDPYPFILMNLLLSLQAAYTAPVIMMSQNRQAMRDRIAAQHDYVVNEKTETEVQAVLEHLSAQDRALEEIHLLLLDAPEAKKG